MSPAAYSDCFSKILIVMFYVSIYHSNGMMALHIIT